MNPLIINWREFWTTRFPALKETSWGTTTSWNMRKFLPFSHFFDNCASTMYRRLRTFNVRLQVPETKTLNLHSPTFPVLSEAWYRIVCSPAGNLSPGLFPECVMLGMSPELSVAVGPVHVTVADVVPRSAVVKIFEGQFVNVGPETSWIKMKSKQWKKDSLQLILNHAGCLLKYAPVRNGYHFFFWFSLTDFSTSNRTRDEDGGQNEISKDLGTWYSWTWE